MTKSRVSLFGDIPEIDLSGFTTKPRPDPKAPSLEEVRAISEAANFPSREAAPARQKPPENRRDRRYRTGRNVQLNIKVTEKSHADFYAIVDAHAHEEWTLGYTFERAIAALKRELTKEVS